VILIPEQTRSDSGHVRFHIQHDSCNWHRRRKSQDCGLDFISIYLPANFKEQFVSFSFIPSPAVEKFMQFALAFEFQTYFGNTARIQ
jgi:hypothetical protein